MITEISGRDARAGLYTMEVIDMIHQSVRHPVINMMGKGASGFRKGGNRNMYGRILITGRLCGRI